MSEESPQKIGYIVRKTVNGRTEFSLREAAYERRITSKSDKIYSKMLLFPVDFCDVAQTTELLSENGLIVVQEPFFLRDDLKRKVENWIAWANEASPKEYDLWSDET